ncbi:protein serine/threonine phosphatase 2C [Flagelloscypha sp. PMI_526]|nr:protein serine/threonine phosphatase 2C [Flagelloscypha sp. PMI_526]
MTSIFVARRTAAVSCRNSKRVVFWHFRAYSTDHEYPKRPFTFHVGASWQGKTSSGRVFHRFPTQHPINVKVIETLSNPPRESSDRDIGDDFFFVQPMRDDSGLALGVADGVGGWHQQGIDPSLFSQALMYHNAQYAQHAWAGEPEIDPMAEETDKDFDKDNEVNGEEAAKTEPIAEAEEREVDEIDKEHEEEYDEEAEVDQVGEQQDAVDLLVNGYYTTLQEVRALGSSTATIVTLNSNSAVLSSANLGDSGFLVYRSGHVVYNSGPSHYFGHNLPAQLSNPPALDSNDLSTPPEEAKVDQLQLQHGDVVVLYVRVISRTGLSDNVDVAENPEAIEALIASVLRRQGSDEEVAQGIADAIVAHATAKMADPEHTSPFEVSAQRNGYFYRGPVSLASYIFAKLLTEDIQETR